MELDTSSAAQGISNQLGFSPCVCLGPNDLECGLVDSHLNRRAAHIFPIGINIQRMFRLNPYPARLKVRHLRDLQMIPMVDSRKQPQEPEPTHRAHGANVEQPIIQLGPRCNLHPAAIHRSIGKRGQNRRLIAASRPACTVFLRRGDLHRQRRKRQNGLRHAQQISSMPPQPPWQPVGPLRHFSVESHTGHATKVPRCMWRGPALSDSRRPVRVLEGSNHSQINEAHVFCAHTARTAAEFPPRRQRIPHPPQPQSPRKVIPTPRRHHQHRQSQPHQLPQMPMDRPIATKHKNNIGEFARSRHPHRPIDALLRLKALKVLERAPQPENGSCAHIAGRE